MLSIERRTSRDTLEVLNTERRTIRDSLEVLNTDWRTSRDALEGRAEHRGPTETAGAVCLLRDAAAVSTLTVRDTPVRRAGWTLSTD